MFSSTAHLALRFDSPDHFENFAKYAALDAVSKLHQKKSWLVGSWGEPLLEVGEQWKNPRYIKHNGVATLRATWVFSGIPYHLLAPFGGFFGALLTSDKCLRISFGTLRLVANISALEWRTFFRVGRGDETPSKGGGILINTETFQIFGGWWGMGVIQIIVGAPENLWWPLPVLLDNYYILILLLWDFWCTGCLRKGVPDHFRYWFSMIL